MWLWVSFSPLSVITPWHYQTQWKLQVLGVVIGGRHYSNLFTVTSADGDIILTSSSEYCIPGQRPYFLVGFCTREFWNFTSLISILHTSLRKPNVAGSRRHCGDAGLPCLWGTRRKSGVGRTFCTLPLLVWPGRWVIPPCVMKPWGEQTRRQSPRQTSCPLILLPCKISQ